MCILDNAQSEKKWREDVRYPVLIHSMWHATNWLFIVALQAVEKN